ncbi:sugar-binding transcriptional regulator [Aureimonas sp. AU12]|uniref:sugar-binding transcriptional regulator n=1 Tax=Aureimonas sp. AU12 TaxID=1638161 RepID=UPI000784D2F4|nr:sugar-binding transcriptional regulator [Aureimonas sp. AU12]
MRKTREEPVSRLDDAARAGWLYYVAGKTQEEIAARLGISRQAAQRLVSLSVSAGLVRVRIEHPIGACLELARRLEETFGLVDAEVVPSDPSSTSTTLGVADACADRLQRELMTARPRILGIGTGRTLRAAVERLPALSCPQHRIVSLTGNIAPDGSASVFNVIFSLADKVEAPHYPMPLPVVASSAEERAMLHEQKVVQISLRLASEADIAFVGVGEVSPLAPLVQDRFISTPEREDLVASGAVGEIIGWVFDEDGVLLDCDFNRRVVSPPIPATPGAHVIGVAMGQAKRHAIHAAIRGRLINGLITDEETATALLQIELNGRSGASPARMMGA